ncbi:MAG: ABC transporter permease [Rhodospirillaceae bacterium]|uniref:ABC transporter permease n=1 Tax=Hwanghaeella sp. 1Z406 TaxID=3402811 RepID=UPI000C549531|nr:ABC transporter permease [Rhodospirillales bacterium]MAX47721.1 ABC transporter permease [Rhodospirillaceae bacterium]
MKTVTKFLTTTPATALFGISVLILFLLVGIFTPVIAPYGETEIAGDQYEVWSETFLLGTDNLGRDILSRLMYGTRNTVGIALLTTCITFLIGTFFGMISAALGRLVDQVMCRIIDVLMAIPSLISALLLLTILGTSIPVLVGVISLLEATRVFRLARSVSMNVIVQDYVEVARLRGESIWYVLVKEVLPNILAPLAAEFGLRFCYVFLFISALSFLGLGIQPPTADWGSMVRENAALISFGDITPLLPAFAIALLTISVNYIVDWFLHKASGLKN